MAISRFSSRRTERCLAQDYLIKRLAGAESYDRIAGYFTSSLLEIAGEAIENVTGQVRVVCNSQLNTQDVRTAEIALRREWCNSNPELVAENKGSSRFEKLYHLLISEKIIVKVLPSDVFGLIHGKAGVIRYKAKNSLSFLGSVNETRDAWEMNYELLWEDDSEESVKWVEDEFEALWNDARAIPLSQCRFILEDVERISRRKVIKSVEKWKENPEPASIFIEEPVYRESFGFAPHQKYFIKKASELHLSSHGARLVLADAVGLGKTIQLAAVAAIAALNGNRPILILAPRTLLEQWQAEMMTLISLPSAVWTGRNWVDENGLEYPCSGLEGILSCPRRIGVVSQGLITSGSPAAEILLQTSYELVIVDEAHRSRRRRLGPDAASETAEPNNLLRFVQQISARSHSLLLATATPVQINPIEAWDLLDALARKGENVLGNSASIWRSAGDALTLTLGQQELPADLLSYWPIIRNPFPARDEGTDFDAVRRQLTRYGVKDADAVIQHDARFESDAALKQRLNRIRPSFARMYNPFIRSIIRRTREYLQDQIDPTTGQRFLKPIRVDLYEKAIPLPIYLREAYELAEEFSRLLGMRKNSVGFLKTMLLRRLGSSIIAGMNTAKKLIGIQSGAPASSTDIEDEEFEEQSGEQSIELLDNEKEVLEKFLNILNEYRFEDPKINFVRDVLAEGLDGTQPWIESGCILFSQYFDTAELVARHISQLFPEQMVAIYAGGNKSRIVENGIFTPRSRDEIKKLVTNHKVRLLVGTDAASEGLNLQTLGTLINVDLPWNPTRLEQRKGRIQRMGQALDEVRVCNLRYKDSVEDRVHELLSERLKNILDLFGQVPDVLEDAWIEVALGEREEAKKRINDLAEKKHPFELRFSEVKNVDWESCADVLDKREKLRALTQGWK